MSINTTPLAPRSMVRGSQMQWTMPDTRAVNKMHHSIFQLPYFSSRGGPTTKRRTMLPM